MKKLVTALALTASLAAAGAAPAAAQATPVEGFPVTAPVSAKGQEGADNIWCLILNRTR